MACFLVAEDASESWSVVSLEAEGGAYFLTGEDAHPLCHRRERSTTGFPAVIVRHTRETKITWTLMTACGERIRINGQPMVIGIHVLADNDELCVEGCRPLYFSATNRVDVVIAK
jgi:hypothetical protein